MADLIGQQFEEAWKLLGFLYNTDEEKFLWMESPQKLLDNKRPNMLINAGQGERVLDMLRGLESGIYV